MTVQPQSAGAPPLVADDSTSARVYAEGVAAGVIGAATIAIWFSLVDLYYGRPFYTPNILSAALFRSATVSDLANLPVSFEMVLYYTWVHGLVFCILGAIAAVLLDLAERNIHFGFGVLLFFIVFEFGFIAVAMVVAEPILRALAWPSVLFGNLLAAVAMALYFWRHHPTLRIAP